MVDAVKLIRKIKLDSVRTKSESNSSKNNDKSGNIYVFPFHKQTNSDSHMMERVIKFTNRITVTLLEDSLGIWAAGNGAALWDASLLLCHYLIHKYSNNNWNANNDIINYQVTEGSETMVKDSIERARGLLAVVELGSGLGLNSMVAAKLGMNVFCTERKLALDLLRHNIQFNASIEGSTIAMERIKVRKLDWNDYANGTNKIIHDCDTHIDLVIGSDLVFSANSDSWEGLAKLYSLFLHGNAGCRGILTYERRAPDSLNAFIKLLQVERINIKVIESNSNNSGIFGEVGDEAVDIKCDDICLLEMVALADSLSLSL